MLAVCLTEAFVRITYGVLDVGCSVLVECTIRRAEDDKTRVMKPSPFILTGGTWA